jgi:hypothetical protein
LMAAPRAGPRSACRLRRAYAARETLDRPCRPSPSPEPDEGHGQRSAGRGTCPRAEHEVRGTNVRRPLPMSLENQSELARDRHGPHRVVGLRRTKVAVSVDFVCEFHLRVLPVADPHVRPPDGKRLREPRTRGHCEREQRPVGSGAAAIVCSSSPAWNSRRRTSCDGFGRSDGSIREMGFVPAQPIRRAA